PFYSALVSGILLCSAAPSRSQSLTFNTVAGYAGPGSSDGTGASARFANPWGVAADGSGNLYVADTDNNTIRKITSGGLVTTLAGQAGASGSANGTGSGALFNQPQGVAVDAAGDVYVADTGNYTIRKITPLGVVTTLAGSPGVAGSTDATGSSALFNEPEGIAVNSAGTLIYVADTWNHTIRQITAGAVVSTLAGSAGNFGNANGTGSGAQFYQPQGVAVDSSGNVYVGDTGNQTIRMVTSGGVVTTLAGSAGTFGSTDATGTSASFWGPQGLAVDSALNVYVADAFNHTIRKITSGGAVTTLAGTAGSFGSTEGTGAAARFWQPQSVAADASGNVYVADSANGTIRKIDSGAVVTTVAGSASVGSADGPGSSARFYWPSGAAVDSATNCYVADTENGTLRKVSSSGTVSTLAGLAGQFGSADGTGSSASFYGPQGVAVDSSGNIYVADTANHTIRKVTSGGSVSTLAGLAGSNGLVDGTGNNARFNNPQGVAVDTSGNVYVADTWNHTIRKVTSAGVVTTLAGLPGYAGSLDSN
ncbi:MAG TPA: NHL repeat-containing protein, partial [Micrococcaceae bacterium]